MRRVTYKRASATNPGKHGHLDWRVEFNGTAPTHSEVVFMVGMLLLAEERYNGRGQDGNYRLFAFLDRLLHAKTPEDVVEEANDCQESVDNPRSVRKTRAVA